MARCRMHSIRHFSAFRSQTQEAADVHPGMLRTQSTITCTTPVVICYSHRESH